MTQNVATDREMVEKTACGPEDEKANSEFENKLIREIRYKRYLLLLLILFVSMGLISALVLKELGILDLGL